MSLTCVGGFLALAATQAVEANPLTTATSCAFGSGVTAKLNLRAAASVATGSHGTVGAAKAAQIASGLQERGDLCKFTPDSRITGELANIAAQYKQGTAQGQAALASFLQSAQSSPRAVHAPRLVAHGGGPCPAIAPTIHVSGAATTVDDLRAAQVAAAAGDDAGANEAMNAAAQAFESWAGHSGATTVGDWLSIAAAALALGDETFGDSAVANAQSAAAALLKKSTPKDPCKASSGEIKCFVQAAAVAEMLGLSNVPDLSSLLDCNGQLWSFSMSIRASGVVARWNRAEFRLAKDGTITPAGRGSGFIPGGDAKITGSCGNSGDFLHANATSFHYSIKGRRTSRFFALQLDSPDLKLTTRTNPNPSICLRAADGILKLIFDSVLAHFPVALPARASQTSVTWTFSSGGVTGTVHAARL